MSHSPSVRYVARRAAAVLALGLLAVAVGTSHASAAVPGLALHTANGAVDSTTPKSVSAACPATHAVTGVGGYLRGSSGRVVIDDLTPNVARTQALTTGYEILPYAGLWSSNSVAICARPLAGAVRVATASALTSSDKSITATCPAGTRLTGSGGEVTGGLGKVSMDDLTPTSTSVTVTGNEIDPVAANWRVTAYALCAAPLPGQVLVSATTVANSVDKSVSVACPAGTRVTGLGGTITGATGEATINSYLPNAALTAVSVTAYESRDADGLYAGNWSVRAYALCATP